MSSAFNIRGPHLIRGTTVVSALRELRVMIGSVVINMADA